MNILLVALGGAIGSVFRYILGLIVIKINFPLNTLLINILGAIFIGIIVGLSESKNIVSDNYKLFLQVGFCGGFTTFSTFSLESINLIEKENYLLAVLYIIFSVIFCLIGVIIGKKIANFIV